MASKKKIVRYPPLPKHVPCPGGDVDIILVTPAQIAVFADPGEELFGVFVQAERRIYIRKTMSREQQHRVAYHEIAHVAFEDSGIANGLDRVMEEAIADAFASMMMRMRFG
jgi:hypothetical protein